MVTDSETIHKRLAAFAPEFDRRFRDFLDPPEGVPAELAEAAAYAALGPGKRVRPYLLIRCCELVGGTCQSAWAAAAAVECIHTFSLVHDDLPAMDNDDLRRGRPTCHKRFGEATAILAGDALVMLAFELLTRESTSTEIVAGLVAALAEGSGWAGMIGGQAADILGEGKPPSIELVEYIHARKTAGLFRSACRMGAMLGRASDEVVENLGRYGFAIGTAFQMADDLLDVTATAATLGKPVRKDAERGKQTYPRCVGPERSAVEARSACERAKSALSGFGVEADELRDLADYAVSRNY
jgi:geranylgeranyl pyrophosphate synthase